MKIYDSIVIGGGPAGLSAAVYLARFNRSVLVLDSCEGRWQSREINENYLGFPDGIPARALVFRGRQQAEKFGAVFLEVGVKKIEKHQGHYQVATTTNEIFSTKTILFATGVSDRWPQLENLEDCIGLSLFWCITCDGYKTRNKKVLIVGSDDEAVVTCLQFLEYTKHLTFVTNSDPENSRLSFEKIQLLKKYAIPLHESPIAQVDVESGSIQKIHLENGVHLKCDFMFNQLGADPRSELAHSLGVTINDKGYIMVDREQRTTVEGLYAAGDVTEQYAHQIVTAAHEGAQAAQAINYDLYSDDQRS